MCDTGAMQTEPPKTEPTTGAAWSRRLAAYREPNAPRSLVEIAITAGPLMAIWGLAWFLHRQGYWWAALLLSIPAAGFLVRLFMIQHDCGHGAFFRWRQANDWVGRVIGVLTLTPYDYWRHTHAIHHATSGNLDRRTLGAIETLTVDEYLALSPARRLGYRLYRNPAVMFGLGPAFVFFLMQRLPIGMMRQGWRPWLSALGTTAAVAAVFGGLIWIFGAAPVLVVNVATLLLAATVGVWLFYVQHQFEDAYWETHEEWDYATAAITGSSHLRLHPILQWFTGSIGLHHVHHIGPKIPNFRLQEAHDDNPIFEAAPLMTIGMGVKALRLALYDEDTKRLVRFSDVQAA